ncbi:MAG: hypothetical protein ABJD97_21080 [Betaproteobacteria bacterium]
MNDDIDTALEAEVTRRATALGIRTSPPGERSRVARLASRLYTGAGSLQRSRIVTTLLRPLGPLAIVAVASGAFAGLLTRVGSIGQGVSVDELGAFSGEQIFELARFVEQVSPDALRQAAGAIVANPFGVSTFGAAAAVLLAGATRNRQRDASVARPLD